MRRTARPRRVWTMPIALGVLCAFGLVSGLLGEGLADALAWLALGTPAALALRPLGERGRRVASGASSRPEKLEGRAR